MSSKNFERLRTTLKEKGTLPLDEVSKLFKKNEFQTKQMLLQFLYNEIIELHPATDPKKIKYLYKIFKYFDIAESQKEKDSVTTHLNKLARLCNRRLNKLYKDGQLDLASKEPNVFQKLLDMINVTKIGLKYYPTVPGETPVDEVSYELLNYLIYDVRNYNYLFELLKTFPKNLNVKNEKGNYLIEELLDKYISIVKKGDTHSEIIYYEKVIKLFLSDPKLNIEEATKEKMLRKLERVLVEVRNSHVEEYDRVRTDFFINEAIRDIKDLGVVDDIEKLNYKYDVRTIFPKEVLDAVYDKDVHGRLDYIDCRDKYTITIDKEGTWVYDDACSLEVLPNGNYLLGVYIADATLDVPRNSLVDLEARKRVETIYVLGGPYTLLPETLTRKLSLSAHEDKKAIGFFYELDSKLNVVDFKINRCLINVDKNYSYETANDLLVSSNDLEEIKLLKNMYQISNKMHQNANERLKYRTLKKVKKSLKDSTTELPLDASNNPSGIMIAEFMVQTNYFIADFFQKHPEIPFIYRINLSSYGNDIIDKIKDISGANMSFEELLTYINYICPPSVYSVTNLGHNGLKLDAYCHGTNPLRNYSSLEIERIIVEFMINDGRGIDLDERKKFLTELCEHMNTRMSLDNDYVEEVKQLYKKINE